MANQDILGTTNCSCCGARVNLKRNKSGKAYYFCNGELDLFRCDRDGGKMPAAMSRRIIAVSAKHGNCPHFTKMKLIDGLPVVEIEQENESKIESNKDEKRDSNRDGQTTGSEKTGTERNSGERSIGFMF